MGQGVDGPHGLRYDASGDLWVADPGSQGRVIRIDHSSGKLIEVARVSTATVLPTGRGVYVTVGNGSGGRVLLIRPDGGRRTVVGTGRISRQRNGVRATRVGILPTALALARNGSLLVAQAKPVPALRRVSPRRNHHDGHALGRRLRRQAPQTNSGQASGSAAGAASTIMPLRGCRSTRRRRRRCRRSR